MKKGILYGVGAYLLWGAFPFYWKLLKSVPAIQLISHRIIWSFILLMSIIFFTRQWQEFQAAALSRRAVPIYLGSAILLGINWLTYVWAINAGFVVETSLGLFHQSAAERPAGRAVPARAPAPMAVGIHLPGCPRRTPYTLFRTAQTQGLAYNLPLRYSRSTP